MNALPRLPQLTPDERYWRVDWFGECAYPGGVRRYSQPSIRIALSPLLRDPKDQAALLLPDSTDHHHQHEAWPPVAALPLLAIGDIWHNGHHFVSPDYQVESFKRLRIAPETSAFVKAGLAMDGQFLLPLGRHPWHRNHTQSYCVAISLDEHRRLLVPCMELIRFYFGSSSNLLQRLFTAPLTAERLWAKKRFNAENRHLHLVLASRLSGVSAADIGRVAESGFAWRAAAGIYASCQKATAQRHPVYPYTGFPFEGTTDLVATGMWLPLGEREGSTFLAYRLLSCSHPFPFRSLSYEASDRKLRSNRAEGVSAEDKRFSRVHPKADSAALDADPGGRSRHSCSFRCQKQFPDLARKQVWRERIESIPKADVFLRRADGNVEQVAFGESEGHSNVAGLEVIPGSADADGRERMRALPHFVSAGLRVLREGSNVGVDAQTRLVCPLGRNALVFSLPVVIDEDGEIASTLLFTAPDGRVRQRRACFVGLGLDTAPRYMLLVEGQTRIDSPHVLPASDLTVLNAVLSVLQQEAGDHAKPRHTSYS